jgi:hypothetical protein
MTPVATTIRRGPDSRLIIFIIRIFFRVVSLVANLRD